MKAIALLISAIALSFCARSQSAYWVIESNIKTPRLTLVKVYDLNDALITEYRLDRKIVLSKKGDKRMLTNLVHKAIREQQYGTRKTRRSSARAARV